MLSSPFSILDNKTEKIVTFFLAIMTICIGYAMLSIDYFLINDICENGIISFELAKDIRISQAILNSWDANAKINAGISLGLDFLFLTIYPALIALLIHKLNKILWHGKPFYLVGLVLLFSQFFTAFFDAIENIGLIHILLGSTDKNLALMAYYFATIKFTLIIVALLYLFINFIIYIITNTNKNE
ncbi:hypothetical protein H0I31_04845 [Tenacibaculum sp. AHE15PA]|uniref:hypothetical protein n=1 Tax=unclassified Tenacibaculum TaxID=2635139 RepID=UPI001C4F1D3B|nr:MULTISPECIES: hypothetical protein [unclassified Tenacibaculum]QXP73028.1 hypothetical protein H0I30_10105 [Tenacibaculum sp. AHE14PA]QXP76942.1 hypothetical protein H0I31_04845 [Tenacibaculum sp. AHE15PA]